jgi:transcriptional regulator with XRE-family HTH domain
MVELKMYEKKLNRINLAKLLGIGAPKLSQILNNKREPDVTFLKALHEKLGLDGNFILDRV